MQQSTKNKTHIARLKKRRFDSIFPSYLEAQERFGLSERFLFHWIVEVVHCI